MILGLNDVLKMYLIKINRVLVLKISELVENKEKEFSEIIGVFDFLGLFCENILQ